MCIFDFHLRDWLFLDKNVPMNIFLHLRLIAYLCTYIKLCNYLLSECNLNCCRFTRITGEEFLRQTLVSMIACGIICIPTYADVCLYLCASLLYIICGGCYSSRKAQLLAFKARKPLGKYLSKIITQCLANLYANIWK